MSKIKNRDELSYFLDILYEFMDLDDCQFSFEELSTAANTFLRTAKGEVAKQKVRAPHLSHHSAPLDTYDMIIKQPAKLTVDCLQDFGMIEDCIYARTAQAETFKQFVRG